jgi:phosphoglycerol transferase MdoB-like AlkP superfamily enzyme
MFLKPQLHATYFNQLYIVRNIGYGGLSTLLKQDYSYARYKINRILNYPVTTISIPLNQFVITIVALEPSV